MSHCGLDLWSKVNDFSVVSNRSAKTTSNRCIRSAVILFTSQTHTHTDKLQWKYNQTPPRFRGGVNIGKNDIMCYELNLFVSCGCGVYVLSYFIYMGHSHNVILLQKQIKQRSIQRTQTPPRLWSLTLTCDLDHTSRSRKLMSLDVAYYIVPWFQVWCLWM